jgi:glyoxylase-like metal-dependent hydrolase (beta-lactamase superfamily II)
MEQIIVLDITYQFDEHEKSVIHPVVLMDEDDMILVDCGYEGFPTHIEDGLQAAGLDCGRLTKMVITHQDNDHMGAAAALKRKYPNIKVVASAIEAPYISGKKKLLRLVQAEELQERLPEEQKGFGEEFCAALRSIEPVSVDLTVNDGDHFPWCGGCEIVATPGHMPGHIALFLKRERMMITGDAAVYAKGRLMIANPQYALDQEEAERSLSKMLRYPADTFICYHGGVFRRSMPE